MNPARPMRPILGFRFRRSVVRERGGAATACARAARGCAGSGCAAAKRLRKFRTAAALAAVCACCPPLVLLAAAPEPDAGVEPPSSVRTSGPSAGDDSGRVPSEGRPTSSEPATPGKDAAAAPADGRQGLATFGSSLAASDSASNEGDGSAGAAAAFGEPGEDPVAAWKEALIEDTGLLARQSEISESILLIERQIRRAELLARLLALVGPDAPIETAPGVFERFGDSPAGRRIAAEMAESDLDAQKRLLELRLEIVRSGAELARQAAPPPPEAAPVPEAATLAPPPTSEPVLNDRPALEEISGFAGTRWAVFRFGDERVRAKAGDTLPNGARVSAIDWDAAELVLDGERAWWRIER